MNNLKHSLKVAGIAALVMLVLVIVLVAGITATSQPATTNVDAPDTSIHTTIPTVQPTPTIDIATLPAYQLASIDGVDSSDTATIAAYQKVLDSLYNKTGDSEVSIANATYAGQGILTKDGYLGTDNTMIDLMKAVDSAITKPEHMKYNESLSALIILMENPS